MSATIPAASDIRTALEGLSYAKLTVLAELSGVPFQTLWKVRAGTTLNPGIETVRKFADLIDAVKDPE